VRQQQEKSSVTGDTGSEEQLTDKVLFENTASIRLLKDTFECRMQNFDSIAVIRDSRVANSSRTRCFDLFVSETLLLIFAVVVISFNVAEPKRGAGLATIAFVTLTALPVLSDVPIMICTNTMNLLMFGLIITVKEWLAMFVVFCVLISPNFIVVVKDSSTNNGILLLLNCLYYSSELIISMRLQKKAMELLIPIKVSENRLLSFNEDMMIESVAITPKCLSLALYNDIRKFVRCIKLRFLSRLCLILSSFIGVALSLDDDALQGSNEVKLNNLVNLFYFFAPGFLTILTIDKFNKEISKIESTYACSLFLKVDFYGLEVKYATILTFLLFIIRNYVI
jgi:hypothetical protein